MCKSKDELPPFGCRCDSAHDELHRAVTVSKQSVNRHLRAVSDAELTGDLDALDRHYMLFNKNIQRLIERSATEADARGIAPPPAPTRAEEFTYANATDYTDNQLRSISKQMHWDPEAQDMIQATLERRYQQSAYEAFGDDLHLDFDSDTEHAAAAYMQEVKASQYEPTWGGPMFADPPRADEYAQPEQDWEDSHIVYEVPDLTDAEMFREFLKIGSSKTPDEECRAAYEEWNLGQYDRAVEDCAGVLLNSAGKRKGVSSYDLFMGNPAVAKKYASEELQSWWRSNGRRSYSAFRYGYFGRDADRRAWELSRIEDFANVA